MRRRPVELVLALALASVIAGPGAGDAPDCTCRQALKANIWCEAHSVGYIATVPVRSHALFEATDAHGHEIDRKDMRCATCLEAIERDEYCARCRVGYVGGQAYLSRLTYLLATGTPHDPEKLSCDDCRAHATRLARPLKRPTLESFGWCAEHRRGWVGNIAFSDRERFDETATAFRLLLRAIELADRCENCATACYYDSYCPTCRIQYRNGRPVDGHR